MSTTAPPTSPAQRPASFNWRVPGVTVPVPPTRVPLSVTRITPWDRLEFTPAGAYEVRRHLGVDVDEYGRFNLSRDSFLASDIAFLAAGASEDGKHSDFPYQFFPEFHALYKSTPKGSVGSVARKDFGMKCRQLIFDLATKHDRSTGGTTFIVHCPGTTVPGTSIVPENLKASVYFPPHLIEEHPELRASIAYLVQTCIEHLGVVTAKTWTTNARKLWSLSQTPSRHHMDVATELIPSPLTPRSAHYLFIGRPWGQLAIGRPTAGPSTHPAPADGDHEALEVYDIDEITMDDDTASLIDALESAAVAQAENCALHAENRTLHAENRALKAQMEEMQVNFEQREHALELEVDSLRRTRVRPEAPSTPSRAPQPPPYTPSRVRGSPAPFALSPRRGTPAIDLVSIEITENFLNQHALMDLHSAVDLLVRYTSPVNWMVELSRLNGLPAELANGLLQAMDDDRKNAAQ
ncbi:hypothetical protein B0H11DRAFT_2214644 [Mycena galericulata]|nr:hypothetical protein B0H11DRAFT_2214644 [Mycena galericulata]